MTDVKCAVCGVELGFGEAAIVLLHGRLRHRSCRVLRGGGGPAPRRDDSPTAMAQRMPGAHIGRMVGFDRQH